MKKQLLQVIFALAFVTNTVYAQQPGSLDVSFNGKGTETFSFATNTEAENVTASYLQPDGKLLVAMTSSNGGNFDTTSYVARFMTDGSPDLSFGVNGKKELDSKFLYGGNFYFIPYAIALQSDGTIILGGVRRNFDQNTASIVSLKPDGSFNELFANGLACTVLGEDGNIIKSLSIHKKTGNIWACGESTNSGNRGFFICAVTRTGQTFIGDGGQIYGHYFPDGVYNEYASSSVIKGDVFYMGGTVVTYDAKKHFGVMAIDVNSGNLSGSFFNNGEGGTGTVNIPLPPEAPTSHDECTALSFSPDSMSLFLAGYTLDSSNLLDESFMLAKVNLKSGGYIDTAFSTDGTITYKMAGTNQNYLRSLAIDASGRMLLAGTLTNSLSYWTAIRVLPNGNIDNSFGKAGRKTFDGTNGTYINSFNLRNVHYNASSKKYVLTGHTLLLAQPNLDGIANRINYSGDADNGFGTSSQIVFWGKDDNAVIKDISLRGDGKMVIGGPSQNADTGINYVALLNADGSQDKTFGSLSLATLVPALSGANITDVEVLANNKILVAGYYLNSTDDAQDIFILRLKENGTLDTDFNGVGYYTNNISTQNDFTQGIALRSDGAILLYGFFNNGTNFNPGVLQLSADGVLNTSFGTNGIHVYPEVVSSVDGFFKSMDAKVRPDGKVIVAGYHDNGSNADVLVYRLTATGALDNTFGVGGAYIGDYGFEAAQYAYAVALTPDDKIVVAGQTSDEGGNNNLLIMLTKDGAIDTTFATSGWLVLNKSSDSEALTFVSVNNNKIVAAGLVLKYNPVTDSDDSYYTAMRFTMAGLLDNTFANRGYTVIGKAYALNGLVANNKLYFAGADRKLDGQTIYKGIIGRINLNSGPVVKLTNLQATDYNKFLGDAAFVLTTVSNSPAVKTYAISSSGRGCVSVNPTTGLVAMTCATVTSSPVTIQIIQPAVSGFTADTAYSTINVGKGIPSITFNPQGDTLTSTFTLKVSSKSDAYPQFNAVGGDYSAVYLNGDGTAYANQEGCTEVQAYYYETDNYLAGYVNTSICAYLHLLPPAAFNDNINLSYPVEGPVYFSPLANDEAYTGTISPAGLDLDPSTPGIQHSYNEPAVGRFDADTTTGVVTYTAFSAFLGTSSIDYVVYDSKGTPSPKSKINVTVTPSKDVSDLRATELFTPNNDGLNDAFVIGHVIVPNENQLKVFDRNGQEIFSKNNYQNDWKGELENGKLAENGIYYFTYTENDGDKTRELKGAVELRR